MGSHGRVGDDTMTLESRTPLPNGSLETNKFCRLVKRLQEAFSSTLSNYHPLNANKVVSF